MSFATSAFEARDNGEPRCISFGGFVVDDAMAKEILRVVQPAAIDAAVVASEDGGASAG